LLVVAVVVAQGTQMGRVEAALAVEAQAPAVQT